MTFNTRTCPDCETDYPFHLEDCDLSAHSLTKIETAYTDIISRLTGRTEGWTYDELRSSVESFAEKEDTPDFRTTSSTKTVSDHMGWTVIHDACLHHLKYLGRAEEVDGEIDISIPEQRVDGVVPLKEPLKTVFEYGPIDGCKDYAVYSMVSWCELIDLEWSETVAFVVYWLRETGRWETESWSENTPKELVMDKRHVYEKGLGWGEYPEVVKSKLENSSEKRRLDADEVSTMLDRELLRSMTV